MPQSYVVLVSFTTIPATRDPTISGLPSCRQMRSFLQVSVTVLPVIFATIAWAELAGAQSVEPGEDALLTCDVPLAASFETTDDRDFFTFSVSDGEIVTITTTYTPDPLTPNPYWRLLIDGSPASSCGTRNQ